jgi:hypothetical protein
MKNFEDYIKPVETLEEAAPNKADADQLVTAITTIKEYATRTKNKAILDLVDELNKVAHK